MVVEKSAEGIVGRKTEGPNVTMNEVTSAFSRVVETPIRRLRCPKLICGVAGGTCERNRSARQTLRHRRQVIAEGL